MNAYYLIRNRRTFGLLTTVLMGFALTFTACKDESNENPNTIVPTQNITQTVGANTNFTLLNAALTRANLGATLSGTGPFTVFAPTDDAFRAAGYADAAAINRADATTLSNILLYHVVSGTAVTSATIPSTLR